MKKNLIILLSAACLTLCSYSAFAVFSVSLTPSNHNGYSVSCFGGVDGAINITVTGGTSPYTYRWSTGATTQNVSSLAAGYYQVTVTDANSATCTGNVTLTQPTILTLSLTASHYSPQTTNISCYNCCNGYININMAGGVTSYTYIWNSGQTTGNITNLCKNTYKITVTDANGCTIEDQQVMTEPAKNTWAMTGDSGSSASTNFIGTTDNVDFVFKTNNSEALRIKANGDMKISSFTGTGDKVVLTDGNGTLFNKAIYLPSFQTCTDPYTFAWRYKSGSNPPAAYACWERIGVGTETPHSAFEVKGDARFTAWNSTTQSDYLELGHDGLPTGNAFVKNVGQGNLLINYNNQKDVSICTGNSGNRGNTEIGGNVYLATESGKKVGIATSNPIEALDVAGITRTMDLKITNHIGTGNRYVYTDATGILRASAINFSQAAPSWETQGNNISSGDFIGTTNNNDFIIKANSNEKMRVGTDGNVTIITTPNSSDNSKRTVLGPLLDDVNGTLGWGVSYLGFNAHRNSSIHEWTTNTDGSHNGGAAIWGTIHGDIYFASVTNTSSNSNTDQTGITDATMTTKTKLKIANNGRIGIGTTDPVTKLDVRGFVYLSGANSGGCIYIPSSGTNMDGFHVRADDTPETWDQNSERLYLSRDCNFYLFDPSHNQIFKVNSDGYVGARGVKVTQGGFPDYVFNESYSLRKIEELEFYIKENNHLPDMPTACEVEDNGLDLGEMQVKLVKKIEELTLYVIDLKKENEEIKKELKQLKENE